MKKFLALMLVMALALCSVSALADNALTLTQIISNCKKNYKMNAYDSTASRYTDKGYYEIRIFDKGQYGKYIYYGTPTDDKLTRYNSDSATIKYLMDELEKSIAAYPDIKLVIILHSDYVGQRDGYEVFNQYDLYYAELEGVTSTELAPYNTDPSFQYHGTISEFRKLVLTDLGYIVTGTGIFK